jgi:hypothetical protein
MAKPKWEITDHICRVCWSGRILATDAGELKIFRCSICGTERSGTHQSLCCCGAKIGKKDKARNAGYRCVKNPDFGPDSPFEIMVEVGQEQTLAGDHIDATKR